MITADSHLFHSNFAELLARAARQFGTRQALVLSDRTVSFAALTSRAAVIAENLRANDVRPGDHVAVFVDRPDESVSAFFAALAVGAAGINLNELYRPRQVEHVLNHSGARVLLTTGDMVSRQPRTIDTMAKIIDLDHVSGAALELAPVTATPAQPAQIIYTSGSTGAPKGVVSSHSALWAGVRIVASYLGLRETDRIAGLLPFSFVYGFNQLTTALYTGAALVMDRSSLAQETVATLRRQGVSVLAAVPPLWARLLAVSDFRNVPIDSLRIVTCAGGRLAPSHVRDLRQAQPQAKLYLMYGFTEVFRSTYLPPEEVDEFPSSMGRAIPESTVYVVNDAGGLCEPGEIGELAHGGPTAGLGYLNDPETTARVFRPNPFRQPGDAAPDRVVFSGDLVQRDEGGRLYYVGRRDHMIKTLGFRVSPDEICDVLLASGHVREAAVVSAPDGERVEAIVACIVLGDQGTLDGVRRYCRAELPRYMQPARYVVRTVLPRNPSGKYDLLALKQQVAQPGDVNVDSAPAP